MTMTRARLIHPHTGRPLVPVGYRRDGRPIMPILGAGPEEDDDFEDDPGAPSDKTGDEDDEDDDDSSDENDSSGDDTDWKPPTKAEYEAQQEALRKANKQARDRRLRIKELERGETDDKGKPKDSDKNAAAVRAEVEAEVVGAWKPLVVNTAARAALADAGLIGKPDRLLKLLDLDDIDVDPETGDIDGLDEQIADLKKDYKSLFRRGTSRRIDAADRGERGGKDASKMSATERQAAYLRGDL